MNFASHDTPVTASSVQTGFANLSQDLEARMTGTDGAVPALKIVNDKKPVSRLIPIIARNKKTDRKPSSREFIPSDGDGRKSKRKRAETMAGFDDLGVKFTLKPRKQCWLAHYDKTVAGVRNRSPIAELSLADYKQMREDYPSRAFRPALRRWIIERIQSVD